MKFLYDSLRKKHDEKSAKKLYKLISALIYAFIMLLCAAFAVSMSLVFYPNPSVLTISSVLFCIMLFLCVNTLRDDMKYLHVWHDVYPHLKDGKVEIKDLRGKDIFVCTFKNDAVLSGSYDGEKYVFTVKNDEWNEVGNYTCSDGDFDIVLSEAASYAVSLEKKPEGEYDESLEEEFEETDEEYEEDTEETNER